MDTAPGGSGAVRFRDRPRRGGVVARAGTRARAGSAVRPSSRVAD
ncbi:hypothetical protein APASM_4331 [Actinosynnema pretiosum subsp. pretiosum]|nr:hypothetical protein APASM_4331 [Actinosynnema pretiosum subsp. pretiosum]